MTIDEPLFCITKQLQWILPNEYGEDELVLIMDGLYEEKSSLSMIGSLLKHSDWGEILCKSGVFTSRRADSFLG